MSQDNRLLPLTPAAPLDRPLRELAQPTQVTGSYSLPEPTHLRDYLSVVLKRKWLILSLVTVVTTLVAIQMYRMPSQYEAETTIQIEQKSRSLIRTKDVVVNAGTDPAYWNTQLKLLENPSLHRQVILRLGLQNNPAFLGGQARASLFTTLRRALSRSKAATDETKTEDAGLPVANESAPGEDMALTPEQLRQLEPYEDTLAANLTVDPVERTNLVIIRFRHNVPELARQVSETLAQVFIENDRERETIGTKAAKEATAKQINELQEQVAALEKQRTDEIMRSGLPIKPDMKGVNEPGERVAMLSVELLTAENEVKKRQAEYDAAQQARAAADIFSIPAVQEDKQVQALQLKLADLNEKRAALLEQYTPEWPEVKKIESQITQTQAAQNRVANAIVTGLSAQLDAAKKRAAGLQGAYNHERAVAQDQGIKEIGLGNLEQQLTTSKQMLSTLLQRRTELETAAVEGQASNVSIQTHARTPRVPVGPPRVRNIIIALLLSLGAGIGLAFLLDYLDDTLKSIEDVDRHVHLPTLALIPAPREARRLAFGRGAPATPAGESTALALIEEARAPVAEAYRHLRTSLLLSSAGQPPRIVLVTSSQPSEGKTTTAVNTAMMLAQTGAEVLLLDCDLRRPRVHTHFHLPNARGVTNYLSGDAQVSELIQTYERQPNLKIITSGPVPPNAAELLGSEEMRRLLHLLGDHFAHVIIDSPPAISFTDASILSTMVDGVMLVVHGGRSSRAVVRRAKQQLLDVGAHLFGVVLNNVKLEANDYYYGYGYYANYYAQEGEDEVEEAAAAGADGRSA
jgi:succinoglycan biosynthesis transport protein ExoP